MKKKKKKKKKKKIIKSVFKEIVLNLYQVTEVTKGFCWY